MRFKHALLTAHSLYLAFVFQSDLESKRFRMLVDEYIEFHDHPTSIIALWQDCVFESFEYAANDGV